MRVSIIIPIVRPEKARRCIELTKKNAGIAETEYEIVTLEDWERVGCPLMVKKLVALAKADMVCFLGDDCLPREDFLRHALDAMSRFPGGWGLVGLSDNTGRTLPTHWLAHRKLLGYLDGEFFHSGYKHCFCDAELKDRTHRMGRYLFEARAFVEHDHPILKQDNGLWDADYRRVYSKELFDHDRRLYNVRKANHFGDGKWGRLKNRLRRTFTPVR